MSRVAVLALLVTACAGSPSPRAPSPPASAGAASSSSPGAPSPSPDAAPLTLRVRAIALPGSPERVTMDYVAYDPRTKLLWAPAGNTKQVDLLDTTTGAVSAIAGFATVQRETHGVTRYLGPSSVSIGPDGIVFVGNRGDGKVCAIDARARAIAGCVGLVSPPDGIAYVGAARELWVTTPRERAVAVIDVADPAAPKPIVAVPVDGRPEGYAVDDAGGTFFTNLEDKDRTLAIDVRARRVVSTWSPGCGEEGPRGLAYDGARRFLFVACTDRVVALDARDGKVLGSLATGGGVDGIDYAPATRRLYVAAGEAARLTVAAVDDHGAPTAIAQVPTAEGARVVVAGDDGRAYVPDSARGRILVVEPAR